MEKRRISIGYNDPSGVEGREKTRTFTGGKKRNNATGWTGNVEGRGFGQIGSMDELYAKYVARAHNHGLGLPRSFTVNLGSIQ